MHIRRGIDATPQTLEQIDELSAHFESHKLASTQKVRGELDIPPAEKTIILSKNASKPATMNPSTYNVTHNSHFEGTATLTEPKEQEMLKTTDY